MYAQHTHTHTCSYTCGCTCDSACLSLSSSVKEIRTGSHYVLTLKDIFTVTCQGYWKNTGHEICQAGECVLCLNLSSQNDLFLHLSDLTLEWVHDKDNHFKEMIVRLTVDEVDFNIYGTWVPGQPYSIVAMQSERGPSLTHTCTYTVYMYSLPLSLSLFLYIYQWGGRWTWEAPTDNLTWSCRLATLSELGEWAREKLMVLGLMWWE